MYSLYHWVGIRVLYVSFVSVKCVHAFLKRSKNKTETARVTGLGSLTPHMGAILTADVHGAVTGYVVKE